jgi:hypothetical protein
MATLILVAAIASLMIKREKDRCRLKAMRFAIKADIFTGINYSGGNDYFVFDFKTKPFIAIG